MTTGYFPGDVATVTWERFFETFYDDYVPLMEIERLAQKYLSLRQPIETMIEITKMFHERSLFCLEYASS